MKADLLLSLLQKVRPTGSGEWVACCPAHDDKSPSLAVKETPDGRVLVHCFANCETADVLGAVGLTFSDVMPERLSVEGLKRIPWNPRTVLEAVANNAMIISIMAADVAHGKPLTIEAKDKFFDLSREIQEAVNYATR